MGSDRKKLTKNVNGFSPNQLVFRENPNFPTALNSKLPALVGLPSSRVVANNINAMHTARQAFIQSESSDRIRHALQYQTRTSGDVYVTGDILYYKRENNYQWHGPGTGTEQDGKQVSVKHGSVYVCVYACRITHVIGNHSWNSSTLYCTKTWYHLHISDPFWWSAKNVDCFI